MIFFDSNILVDLLNDDRSEEAAWSESIYAEVAGGETMGCNLIVIAEIAAGLDTGEAVLADIATLDISVIDMPVAVALRSAAAFREYRRRGGTRPKMLPDFLIAAHADTLGATLVTRDRRLASYFPELVFITPENRP